MAFPDSQLDDDIVKFLNDNVIINDVEWDGKVLEINDSDLRNDFKIFKVEFSKTVQFDQLNKSLEKKSKHKLEPVPSGKTNFLK